MGPFNVVLRGALALAAASWLSCTCPAAPPVGRCGDGVVSPGEDCDDGDALADATCDATCHFACGNGALEPGERCDVAAPAGAGECPARCDDGVACTTDTLLGLACQASCDHVPVTQAGLQDGCCPPGATSATDGDCSPACGNGAVDPGERCDTASASDAGRCPTACDDGVACTRDLLVGGGCAAQCTFAPITAPVAGDGCCPGGASQLTDADGAPVCGNGVLEPSERCDSSFAGDGGACPTACSDGVACTADVLLDAGTCAARCVFLPITQPDAGDACCPPGANAGTDGDCEAVCGNAYLDVGELCDPGLPVDAGACAASCDDGQACTVDVLSGSGCQASCAWGVIATPAAGDGCCPSGASALTDSDCAAVCGNGVHEPGERCDVALDGGRGACPRVCNDGRSCTADALDGGGTCAAACVFTPVTLPRNGDGCCPPGENPTTDTDCVLGCGNGLVDPGETCDTRILVGPGRCPTVCADGQACTRDVVNNEGLCTAACSFPPITLAEDGDGCCPPGANANTDDDCAPSCGNGAVEAGETCDDMNSNPSDGCNACQLAPAASAFRVSDLDLRDPHVFVNFLGCRDVTDTPLVGFSINGAEQTALQTDANNDGVLDESLALVFRPLSQADAGSSLELHFPRCTAPFGSTSCSAQPAAAPVVLTSATNDATSSCLGSFAGTTRPYTPAITSSGAPCFVSPELTLTLSVGGLPMTLRQAQVAATYVGAPPTALVNGVIRGFLSEVEANGPPAIPTTFPFVGGQALSNLLPGGTMCCAPHNDLDVNAGLRGWWVYLNFVATRVPWVDN